MVSSREVDSKVRRMTILVKDCLMGRSDKVYLWYVSLLINTRFPFFFFFFLIFLLFYLFILE